MPGKVKSGFPIDLLTRSSSRNAALIISLTHKTENRDKGRKRLIFPQNWKLIRRMWKLESGSMIFVTDTGDFSSKVRCFPSFRGYVPFLRSVGSRWCRERSSSSPSSLWPFWLWTSPRHRRPKSPDVSIYLFYCAVIVIDTIVHSAVDGFGVFNLITFANDPCEGTDNQNGTCYTGKHF